MTLDPGGTTCPGAELVRLTVEADGFAPESRRVRPSPLGEDLVVDVEVSPPELEPVLVGWVVDPEGRLVAGARLAWNQ